jgi:hypothetical protein
MSIITNHWSASGPNRIKDYHIEFGLSKTLEPEYNQQLGKIINSINVDFNKLKSYFNVWKNTDLNTVTSYGTWHLNSSPVDGSPNIEIGALCMGGEGVNVSGPWGQYPYTYAHAWMHAAINARVCYIKKIDPYGSFLSNALQNGPYYNISTHAERAIQTPDNPAANLRPNFGYFAFSGDPDCRWDIAARDVSEANKLNTPQEAYNMALESAKWIRTYSKAIFDTLNDKSDLWGLDKDPNP